MPNPVDVHVGCMVRKIRKDKGLTLKAVAEHLGVRFQQVQKYETAMNRISASKLFHMAELFGVEVGDFFKDI